jgi:hypothetical protein
VKDRIDQMTPDELKAATRELIARTEPFSDSWPGGNLKKALDAFRVKPIDAVLYGLTEQGFEFLCYGDPPPKGHDCVSVRPVDGIIRHFIPKQSD